MRTLLIAAIAVAIATVEAVHYDHFPADLAPAVAPRDNSCAELPKLCTDEFMKFGYATTVTYLCPEGKATAPAPSTVKVTSTKFVTVTVHGASPHDAPAQEPTTTIKSTTTVTEDKWVTVGGRANPGRSLTPPVITNWFSQGTPPPTLTPPVITWSFSQGVPPKKVADKADDPPLSLTPPVITNWFSQGDPRQVASLTPPVITGWFSQGEPLKENKNPPTLTPPVITDWFSQGTPPPHTPSDHVVVLIRSFSHGVPPKNVAGDANKANDPPLSLTPPVITDWFSQGEPPKENKNPPTLTPPVITDWFSQGTPPSAFQTGYYAAKQEHDGHSLNATATNNTHTLPYPTGMSGHIGVSLGALVFGLVAAACFV